MEEQFREVCDISRGQIEKFDDLSHDFKALQASYDDIKESKCMLDEQLLWCKEQLEIAQDNCTQLQEANQNKELEIQSFQQLI